MINIEQRQLLSISFITLAAIWSVSGLCVAVFISFCHSYIHEIKFIHSAVIHVSHILLPRFVIMLSQALIRFICRSHSCETVKMERLLVYLSVYFVCFILVCVLSFHINSLVEICCCITTYLCTCV